MSDLVKRLRERKGFWLNGHHWIMAATPDTDCQKAADRIEELEYTVSHCTCRAREIVLPGDRGTEMKGECISARIQLMERDGHIHAFSDEVPGLNVCGVEREVVLRDVMTAIKFLYREVRGMNVSVEWADQNPLLPPARTKEFRDVALAVSV